MQQEKKAITKKQPLPFEQRLGFSPTEFAGLFGRQAVWGYRQIYNRKVKAIQELGRLIIPKSEIDRRSKEWREAKDAKKSETASE